MKKNRFEDKPIVRHNRSKFDMSHGLKTSMSVGRLYPIDWQEVLPGDSFKATTKLVARVTSSFLKPVMDNLNLEVFHFFVPYRLLYENFERVFGNPNPSQYVDDELAEIPFIKEYFEVFPGSVADYLGLPPGIYSEKKISVLPFRAYGLIFDKWFRNQNVSDELYVQRGEYAYEAEKPSNVDDGLNYCGMPFRVTKRKDYFTSCLPAPQKGRAVSLGSGTAVLLGDNVDYSTLTVNDNILSKGSSSSTDVSVFAKGNTPPLANNPVFVQGGNGGYFPLTTDIDLNVPEFRFAFQLQKMLERDALYGSRYNEYIQSAFGVTSPDSRLQLPEYLGGARIPISVQQVAQTSSATEESPLANVAGYSLSNGQSRFTKSFVEHGIIMTLACIRQQEHTYSQGVDKRWRRQKRIDFYDPLFAHISEQPVYRSELYHGQGSSSEEGFETVFGYNEAWADYRYAPSRISGEMRTTVENTLDIWHFGDEYDTAPVLGNQFIYENAENVDRTLSVPSQSQDNFIIDYYQECSAIRAMPLYSIPGLIDHSY